MSKLHDLLLSDKDFYFKSWDDDAVFRFKPGSGYFIKWPGREPAGVDPLKSNLLADSLLNSDFPEITKEEFDNF